MLAILQSCMEALELKSLAPVQKAGLEQDKTAKVGEQLETLAQDIIVQVGKAPPSLIPSTPEQPKTAFQMGSVAVFLRCPCSSGMF